MRVPVSVLMPVYNCGPYLAQAVESILCQTFDDLELIIIDDGSTDNSLTIIQALAARDSRVQFRSGANTGIVSALNEAIQIAKGEFIARMDGDDFCAPNRLQEQVSFMRANSELLCSGTGILYTDPRGRPLFATRPSTGHDEIEQELLKGDSMAIAHASAIFRAEALKSVGYRPQFQYVEDLDLFLRLSRKGALGNLPDLLYSYRQHPAGTNVQRHAEQQRLRQEALREAFIERNLPVPAAKVVTQTITLGDLYADWSCKAFLGGNFKVGLLYAVKQLVEPRFSIRRAVRFLKILRLGLAARTKKP